MLPSDAATLSSTKPPYNASYCIDGGSCSDTCPFDHALNGDCEDGGPGSESDYCTLGTDCTDCTRIRHCQSLSSTNSHLILDLQQDRTITYPLGCRLDMEVTITHELVATLLLPIAGAVVVLFVALLAAACQLPRRECGVIAVLMRPETCAMQLWMLLLLYPTLAKTALLPFDCVHLGDEELLRADPSVPCEGSGWRVLAALGGIGTITYSLGFPLLCYLVARAAHRAQTDVAHPEDAAASSGNMPARTSKYQGIVQRERRFARAKLLLESYKAEFWYWESLEMLRKYFLTSVVLVLAPDTMVQVFFGLLVCMVSHTLVSNRQPFESQLCGRLQLLALTQLTFTYMAGMLFFESGGRVSGGQLDDDDTWGVVLVIVNTVMVAVLGAGLGGAVSSAVRDVQVEEQLRSQLEQVLREAKGLKQRRVPRLDEVADAGEPVLNSPGCWHFMISYCQHARVAPTIATNLATSSATGCGSTSICRGRTSLRCRRPCRIR